MTSVGAKPIDGPGAVMAEEIAQQPQVLDGLLANGLNEIRAVAGRLREADPRSVLLAGRGTSDHAALYAKYLIEITLGLPCGLASPSTLTAYGAQPNWDRTVWVAVSQSGGSPDLVESTRAAACAGALTVAVTNAPDSALASAAALHVDVRAGTERAVAATKTYTAELLALWLLVDAWRGGSARAAWDVPRLAEHTLARPEARHLTPRWRHVDKLLVTGRGYCYPTAQEAALKLMETGYVFTHAFSGADLLHGPLAIIDRGQPVLAVAGRGTGAQALDPVLDRLRERGADLCVIGDESATAGMDDPHVPLPAGVDEELSPVLEIMPLQQLAHALAMDHDLNPDAPRGLSKITETW